MLFSLMYSFASTLLLVLLMLSILAAHWHGSGRVMWRLVTSCIFNLPPGSRWRPECNVVDGRYKNLLDLLALCGESVPSQSSLLARTPLIWQAYGKL